MDIPYSTYSYFDGQSFEDYGIVIERVHDDLPAIREEMVVNPGRHGSTVSSLTLGPREITLECRAFEETWSDFDSLMDELAAWLVTEDDRQLKLRGHGDQYYMAHYTSMTEGDRIGETGIGGFELVFTASDPIRFGEDRAYVLTGTDQQSFTVGGTEECDMVITVKSATRNTSSKTWGLKSNGTVTKVALNDNGTHTITLDCKNHLVTVDGSSSCLTLDSNWPEFAPGTWRETMYQGTGTATFSWKQRYR